MWESVWVFAQWVDRGRGGLIPSMTVLKKRFEFWEKKGGWCMIGINGGEVARIKAW